MLHVFQSIAMTTLFLDPVKRKMGWVRGGGGKAIYKVGQANIGSSSVHTLIILGLES